MLNNLDIGNQIVAELIRGGVTKFVISPGSRSTPLTVAAARHPQADKTIHYDERGAAFFALGYAKATGRPTVLICTSGTAVANYFPALIEASMDNVPLIILTADRPPELIGVGANQAIFQEEIFGKYPRLYHNLPPVTQETSLSDIGEQTKRLITHSLGERPGPVHMNCQFREPLLPKDSSHKNPTGDEAPINTERISAYQPQSNLHEVVESISSELAKCQRGLIIVGRSVKKADTSSILKLAETLCFPVFGDVQSTLRYTRNSQVINHFDLALLKKDCHQEKPDLVIHFGGPYTSKRLLQFINEPGIAYISVKRTPEQIDPNQRVTYRIVGDIKTICQTLRTFKSSSDTRWLTKWQQTDTQIADLLTETFSSEMALTEPGVSHLLSRIIPEDHDLSLGNSMPIREMEMFAAGGHFEGCIFANRGSSGIDGLLATASGIAQGRKHPLTLLIGDLSFIHDLNSLQLIKRSETPVIMVVINNNGGGIFNFLPVREETDVFEDFFGTPHGLALHHAANLFGIPYSNPSDVDAFETAYIKAVQEGSSYLLEINTHRGENYQYHQSIFKRIRESG